MTISLEEHVTRAILDEFWKCAQEQDWSGAASSAGRLRRAAIAAVREREGAERSEKSGPLAERSALSMPDQDERMRAKCEAITRDPANTAATISARGAAYDIADKIAALKGNGEGR